MQRISLKWWSPTYRGLSMGWVHGPQVIFVLVVFSFGSSWRRKTWAALFKKRTATKHLATGRLLLKHGFLDIIWYSIYCSWDSPCLFLSAYLTCYLHISEELLEVDLSSAASTRDSFRWHRFWISSSCFGCILRFSFCQDRFCRAWIVLNEFSGRFVSLKSSENWEWPH